MLAREQLEHRLLLRRIERRARRRSRRRRTATGSRPGRRPRRAAAPPAAADEEGGESDSAAVMRRARTAHASVCNRNVALRSGVDVLRRRADWAPRASRSCPPVPKAAPRRDRTPWVAGSTTRACPVWSSLSAPQVDRVEDDARGAGAEAERELPVGVDQDQLGAVARPPPGAPPFLVGSLDCPRSRSAPGAIVPAGAGDVGRRRRQVELRKIERLRRPGSPARPTRARDRHRSGSPGSSSMATSPGARAGARPTERSIARGPTAHRVSRRQRGPPRIARQQLGRLGRRSSPCGRR